MGHHFLHCCVGNHDSYRGLDELALRAQARIRLGDRGIYHRVVFLRPRRFPRVRSICALDSRSKRRIHHSVIASDHARHLPAGAARPRHGVLGNGRCVRLNAWPDHRRLRSGIFELALHFFSQYSIWHSGLGRYSRLRSRNRKKSKAPPRLVRLSFLSIVPRLIADDARSRRAS